VDRSHRSAAEPLLYGMLAFVVISALHCVVDGFSMLLCCGRRSGVVVASPMPARRRWRPNWCRISGRAHDGHLHRRDVLAIHVGGAGKTAASGLAAPQAIALAGARTPSGRCRLARSPS